MKGRRTAHIPILGHSGTIIFQSKDKKNNQDIGMCWKIRSRARVSTMKGTIKIFLVLFTTKSQQKFLTLTREGMRREMWESRVDKR